MYVWASLMLQWLRVHLPVQGTRVWSLIQEGTTCRETIKPMRHNQRASKPQLLSPRGTTAEACAPEPVLQKRGHTSEKPMRCNQEQSPAHRHQRKPSHSNEDPARPKINKQNYLKNNNKEFLERLRLLLVTQIESFQVSSSCCLVYFSSGNLNSFRPLTIKGRWQRQGAGLHDCR